MRHRNARFASRASSDYFSYLFFKKKKEEKNEDVKKEGVITNIQSNGVTILIPEYGFEGFLNFESEEEIKQNSIIFSKGGIIKECFIKDRKFNIFDNLMVEVKVEMRNFHKQIILSYIGDIKK